MSKRFTDTEKWDDPWFCELDNDSKLMWFYICDKCNCAGIWKVNFKLMKMHCNTNKTDQEIKEIFKDRYFEFGDKWFIPKFLKFQYPKGLNSEKPAIVGVRSEILSFNSSLLLIIKQSLGNDYLIIKDKDKDKDKDKEQDKEKRGGAGEKRIGDGRPKTQAEMIELLAKRKILNQ